MRSPYQDGNLYGNYFIRQGNLSAQNNVILKEISAKYFEEIEPLNQRASSITEETRIEFSKKNLEINQPFPTPPEELKELQTQKDEITLRHRDNFKEIIGEVASNKFAAFLAKEFSSGFTKYELNNPATPSLSPQANNAYVWHIYDDDIPTISGMSELFLDYNTGFYYHPKVYSWLDNATTGQNLHFGSNRGYRSTIPARVTHPSYIAVRGNTYCTYGEFYAVPLNLFTEETTNDSSVESQQQNFTEILLASGGICRTVPPLPPTPTPTPTPTCEPLNDGVLPPCQTPTPTPASTPTVRVTAVGFTGDRKIKQFEVNGNPYIDEPDGTVPTWKKDNNPEFPVAYLKGTSPTLFAKFSITPTLTANVSAQIRIRKGNQTMNSEPISVTLINNEIRVNDISILFSSLESGEYVKMSEYDFTWQISFDGGSANSWRNIGESEHFVHWLYSNPPNEAEFKPFKNFGNMEFPGLFDLALKYSTGSNTKNEADIAKVVQKINTRVMEKVIYKPGNQPYNGNPLGILNGESRGEAVCQDNALILRGLLNSIGLPGVQEEYHWGGDDTTGKRNYYCPSGGCVPISTERPLGGRTTMQTKRAKLGCNSCSENVEENPSFTYHATVKYDNKLFDPSYGIQQSALELLTAVRIPPTGQPQCVRNAAATALRVTRNDFGNHTIAANNDTNKNCSPIPNSIAARAELFRFDGLGGADLAVVRGSTGDWVYQDELEEIKVLGRLEFNAVQDAPAPADYDGDGLTDPAVWFANGDFFYLMSSNYYKQSGFYWRVKSLDEKAVPGDYDGDNISDIASWRASDGKWTIHRSSDGIDIEIQWGNSSLGDVPVTGDYDGDGKTDVAVWRASTGEWWVLKSSDGSNTTVHWGMSGDIAVQGDYDGDGTTDYAVVRPSTGVWYFLESESGYQYRAYQSSVLTKDDVPVPADYNSDSKTDIAVWSRSSGMWQIVDSQTGEIRQDYFGLSNDIPVVSTSVFR